MVSPSFLYAWQVTRVDESSLAVLFRVYQPCLCLIPFLKRFMRDIGNLNQNRAMAQQISNLHAISRGEATLEIVQVFARSIELVYHVLCIPACVLGVAITLWYYVLLLQKRRQRA